VSDLPGGLPDQLYGEVVLAAVLGGQGEAGEVEAEGGATCPGCSPAVVTFIEYPLLL
jgi:hypothetical protein